MSQAEYFTIETNWGWAAVAGDEGVVTRLVFGYDDRAAARRALADDPHVGHLHTPATEHCWDETLADRIAAAAAGVPVDFDDVAIDTMGFTPFGQRVIKQCRRIRFGQTLSYGELARAAGHPRAARAVGTVMAHNRVPIVVPCHRVIASGGRLGGYGAAAGLRTKRKMLAVEGALPANDPSVGDPSAIASGALAKST
jgi:methylated-DNA-[protein]-cysteine S-methyltransferase